MLKDNTVKNRIQYLKEQISLMIATRDILNEEEKRKMLRNIEDLMRQSQVEVTELVTDELATIYTSELDHAVNLLSARGVALETTMNSMVHATALDNILNDTTLDLSAAYRTARVRLVKNIEGTLFNVKQEIADGVMYGNTRRKTVKRVYDDFLNNGLTSFTTVDGKELPLDFYAETVTRTKQSTASINAHANTYKEAGVNLMEVTGMYDTCSQCAPYHNVVFSTDGQDDRFPHVDVQSLFPLHPNCNCNVLPYILEYEEEEDINDKLNKGKQFNPNTDVRTEEQKKQYKDIQDKRRIARQEVKQYDKIKSVLGTDAPKTIGGFRRMKRAKSKKYLELQSKMRALNKKGG